MTEKTSSIPSRIKNAAVGGFVTGAEDIDAGNRKSQKEVNQEVQESLGQGGSVDSRINAAKQEIIGDAASDYNTLGKLEDKIQQEASTRQSADTAIDGRVETLEEAVGTGGSVDSRISAAVATETTRAQAAEADRYTKSETYSKTELNNLITTPNQEYVSVTATDQTTVVTDVLPATGAADTTYRVGNWDGTQYNDSVFSEYAWNGSAYIKLSTKSQVGEVYDISANHADTKYADLAAALNGGANIPSALRKGGMSVKFVQSSDNKYVQARCMAQSFTTDVTQWAICDDDILVENPEFIAVFTDKDKKVLFGLLTNGDFYFGKGCPQQIKDFVLAHKAEILALVNDKVDKVAGKGLIQIEVADNISFIDSPEWMDVEVDKNQKVLGGRENDGTKVENMPIKTPAATFKSIDNPEWMSVEVDKDGKVFRGVLAGGIDYAHHSIGDIVDITKQLNLSDTALEGLKGALGISTDANSIKALYDNADFNVKLQDFKRGNANTITGTPTGVPVVTLLHFSDIHNNANNMARILQFNGLFSIYIDNILNTGDTVQDYYSQSIADLTSQNGYGNILYAIGNHDTSGQPSGGTRNWFEYAGEPAYNKFIKDYIGNWDVEHDGNHAHCYYYKDYDDSRVRLIVLDNMVMKSDDASYDANQITWFTALLEDARTKQDAGGNPTPYTVVCACHTTTPPEQNYNVTFSSLDTNGDGLWGFTPFVNAVDSFISNGGLFACWLSGHLHDDMFGTIGADNQQMVVCVADSRGVQSVNSSAMSRVIGTKTQDCFNLVAIDTNVKIVKIVRVGADYDRYMRHKGVLCFSYETREIIFNN